MAPTPMNDAQDAAPRDLGRYRLYGEIASGGMATVHFGRLVGTGGFAKTVAIKRLHPHFAKIPEFVTMFLAEARLAARIRHPNVVQPLDVLQIDEEVFLVMEYIDGESLSRQVQTMTTTGARVPLHISVAILCNVLHGLHAAHEAKNDKGEPLGLVHRDVSPQNILVGIDGVARVIDFGIAKAADSVQITRDGELRGKLWYMAPEQLNGGKITRKVDLYAASVVLWEVLTGERLFDADNKSAVLENILHRPVPPPSEIAPDLPGDLDAIVLRGLARDPDDRFASAREMALALEERIVLANPSSIGTWVEAVSAKALAKRAARMAEIERVPAGPSSGTEEIVSEMILASHRGEEPSTRSWKGTLQGSAPPSAPAAAPAPTPILQSAVVPVPVASRPPPPTIAVPEGPATSPEWPVPGIGVAPPVAPIPAAIKTRSQGGGTVVLFLVIALAAALFYFILPELLKRAYVANAARDGVSLTIDQLEVSLHSIHLGGVTMTVAEVPGVTLRARGVDLSLEGLDAKQVAVHDAFLAVDGAYPVIHDAASAWVTARASRDDTKGTIDRITVDSAKVAWNRPFGEATRIDVENATGAVEKQEMHALGDDLEFVAPIVRLTTTSTGKMGPWKVRWQKEPRGSHVNVLLDTASGAQGNVVIAEGGVTDLDLRIPRVALPQLGVLPTAFGRRADDPVFVEATVKYAATTAAHATAEVHVLLSGARLAGAATAADAEVGGKLDGDPTQSLEVKEGMVAFGPFRGKLTGTVGITPGFVKADLGWKATGGRCGGADQSLTGAVRLDSRNLDDASVLLTPNAKCGLKIFGP
jgi:serine/threonine protein kinase